MPQMFQIFYPLAGLVSSEVRIGLDWFFEFFLRALSAPIRPLQYCRNPIDFFSCEVYSFLQFVNNTTMEIIKNVNSFAHSYSRSTLVAKCVLAVLISIRISTE